MSFKAAILFNKRQLRLYYGPVPHASTCKATTRHPNQDHEVPSYRSNKQSVELEKRRHRRCNPLSTGRTGHFPFPTYGSLENQFVEGMRNKLHDCRFRQRHLTKALNWYVVTAPFRKSEGSLVPQLQMSRETVHIDTVHLSKGDRGIPRKEHVRRRNRLLSVSAAIRITPCHNADVHSGDANDLHSA